jgi:RND superfamily putative drug exporter
MRRSGFTGRLARSSARHPWWTGAMWLVVLAASFVLASGIGDVLTDDGDLEVVTEAETADALLAEHFPVVPDGAEPTGPREFITVEASDTTADDAAFQAVVAELTADLRATDGVASVVSYLDGAPGMTSEAGDVALVIAEVEFGSGDRVVEPLLAAVDEADATSGFAVNTVGDLSVNAEFDHLAEETLMRGEMFGISIALVILVLVFGALIAAGIPIVLAIVSIITAVGMTAIVGQFLDLSTFVVNMITMIGLAVGIDYSLFIIQRYREERAKGHPIIDAVERAGDSATRAVFFSGVTVIIALSGLLIMPDSVMRSLGLGAILSVVGAIAAALTLLPAVLGKLGDRVDKLRVPFIGRREFKEGGGRAWHGITRAVTARPVLSVILAGGILVAAAIPYLSIQIGSNGIDSLPEDSTARQAFTVMSQEFDTGGVFTTIVVDGDTADPAVGGAVADIEAALAVDDATYGDVTTTPSPDGAIVSIEAVTKLDPSTEEARFAVEELRNDTIPAAVAGTGAVAYVTGDAAWNADYVGIIDSRTPIIFAFVLGLSFLLLMLVFRSIVVPFKAIVMNLLSVGAAYGLLVLVFQQGVGADLFGFQQTDVIEAWLPLFLFAVLFGLSMDYHIFLLSRIKERYDVTRDNIGSVAFGLGSTGAIITGAALIMVAVFGGFAAGDLVMFQQMGFGLAVAIILDATIVRSVLVPATMTLLGDRNWYFPSWLRWLPEIHIEGHPEAPVVETGEVREPVLV